MRWQRRLPEPWIAFLRGTSERVREDHSGFPGAGF